MMLTKSFLIEHYVRRRKTLKRIARERHVHWQTVWHWLKRHKIPRRKAPGKSRHNLVGRTFGKLSVTSYADNNHGYPRWHCKCSCGRPIIVAGHSLVKPHGTKSCGCLRLTKNRLIPACFWTHIKHGARKRRLAFTITLKWAEKLFDKQHHRCALTGRPIVFGRGYNGDPTASLDRIDNTKGYVPGNVQWLHKIVNLMKHKLTQDEFIRICRDVTRHSKRKKREYRA